MSSHSLWKASPQLISNRLREKLQEFFEDETTGFIDRLLSYLNINEPDNTNNDGQATAIIVRTSNLRGAEDEDDEDDRDRSFKHRRHRYEDDTQDEFRSNRQKRRLSPQDDSDGQNKLPRNYGPHRDDPAASDMTNRYSNNNRRDAGYHDRYNGNNGRPTWKNTKPMCKDYNEKGYCIRGGLCPYDHGKDTIVYEDRNPFSNQIMPMIPPSSNIPINMPNMFDKDVFAPENMTLMQNAMMAFPGMLPSPEDFMKTMVKQQQPQYGSGGGPMKRARVDGLDGRGRGRGGYGSGDQHSDRHQPQQRLTTTLVIDNTPLEKCQMIPINEYFKKFGNITNINLQSQKALVQFSTRAEAEAAHASPEVIFDNRFVKRKNQKRPALIYEPDLSLVAAKAAELQKLRDEKLKKRQEQLKAVLDLQKQKEQLLQQQIDEQKNLLAKLTNKTLTQAQKEKLLRYLRKISSDIDNSKSDNDQVVARPAPPAASMGISSVGLNRSSSYQNVHSNRDYGHGGRDGWPTRGDGSAMMKRSLDNLPTKVMVKDIPQDINEEDSKEHFGQFGRLVSFENIENGAVAHYAQRFEAEKAMVMGSKFISGKLSLSWHTNIQSASPSV
ncbi:hypothetical protein BCR42DRAFT_439776 [Absidia repens]|uniref:C3H1-type domain-containing protein n=1 Tax=Absidia repens TaxID=90262 RepID=A0A1X2IA75_9FUNG|nr:hypothetical protein BCR42DRAFT_439776 [Absidia repens]